MQQELDQTLFLSEEDVQRFRQQGYIKIKDVLSPETLKHFEKVISNEVLLHYNREAAFKNAPEIYAKAFQQISNIWEWSSATRPLVFSKRLANLAAQLLGTRGVRLYHDQALYKEAGGGFTPWHCDQVYWPLASEQTLTIWIPFQDTPMDMGPLGFSIGSHRRKMGRDLIISADSEAYISTKFKDLPYHCTPFELGEVSFHYGYTMHNAGPNSSSNPRKVMTMIYMDQDMHMSTPRSEAQHNDHRSWLPGVTPGHLCDGPKNPVLSDEFPVMV